MSPPAESNTQSGTPLQRIVELEETVPALQEKVEKLEQRSLRKDPVSPRMLALVTVVALLVVVGYLGGIKVLTVEVIAALLGAIAGRLTSNIGGTTDAEEGNRKP